MDRYEAQEVKEIMVVKRNECPYLKARPVGDEIYYWCDLADHPCMVEYNNETCEEWEEIKKEWEDDKL